MIEAIYLAQVDETTPSTVEIQQSGLLHSKVAGRFEIVKELPKSADSFDGMFDYADVYGTLKFAYIDSAHKISSTKSNETKRATAFGGEIGLSTAEYNGIRLNISSTISQDINFLNTKNPNEDFLTADGDSFIYLSQVNLEYSNNILQTKLGRLQVETPYANSDDIRLAPNTFEGVWANVDYTSELKTQIMFLNRWAGYDSQDEHYLSSQHQFKDLVSDEAFGMISTSLTYEYAKNSEVAVWFNYIDEMATITYAEVVGIYFIDGDDFHFDYGLQASHIEELNDSDVDGEVFGAMAILHYNGAFLGGAYNIALSDAGKFVTNGFGGGPYYTSLDEATISSISEARAGYQDDNPQTTGSNNNAESFRIGAGYEFENISIDGLVLEAVYGELYNSKGKIKESDLILSYDFNDRWHLQATYTNYRSSCDLNTFDRTLVKLDYSF